MDMHWRDLIKQEADPRHLNALAGWREAPFFSERERAALHWAEVVNAIPMKDPSDEDFARLQEHFNDTEIVALGYAIAVIKGWNVMNISFRNQIPEVPAPGMYSRRDSVGASRCHGVRMVTAPAYSLGAVPFPVNTSLDQIDLTWAEQYYDVTLPCR